MERGLTDLIGMEDKATLIAALDHDARQPQHSLEMGVRAIRIIANDLERSCLGDESRLLIRRLKSEAASISAAARQVVDAQQDLIDAIRFEFDDTRPTLRLFSASELMDRVLRSNRLLAADVELRACSGRLTVVSDERWLERVLNNLVVNAILHSEATKILITARRSSDRIALEVRDNGRGMSSEQVAVAFDPFSPRAARKGRVPRRSGLGLYNVHKFVSRLGGTFACKSRSGEGTTFRVELPGPIARERKTPSLVRSEDVTPAQNALVAVLGRGPSFLGALERAFERIGVEVVADHDALRWLSFVTDLKVPPDLIVLDLDLQDMNWSLYLDILRKKWGDCKPTVLAASARLDGDAVRDLAKTLPIIQKPFSDEQFNLLVSVLCGRQALPAPGFVRKGP
jgi:two-component sensor histidine kinase/CheY-like chemotaxis protein